MTKLTSTPVGHVLQTVMTLPPLETDEGALDRRLELDQQASGISAAPRANPIYGRITWFRIRTWSIARVGGPFGMEYEFT
jgi:hypothetical protein